MIDTRKSTVFDQFLPNFGYIILGILDNSQKYYKEDSDNT